MKKCTALFMAVFMIVGIIAGGVVFLSGAKAENYVSRNAMKITNDVQNAGEIIGVDQTQTPIRIGTTYSGVYPFFYVSTRENLNTPGIVAASSESGTNFQYYVNSLNSVSLNKSFTEKGHTIYFNWYNFAGATLAQNDGRFMANALFNAKVLFGNNNDLLTAITLSEDSNNQSCMCYRADVDSFGYGYSPNAVIYYGSVYSGSGCTYYLISKTQGAQILGKNSAPSFTLTNEQDGWYYNSITYNQNGISFTLEVESLSDFISVVEQLIDGGSDPDPDPNPDPGPTPIVGGTTFVLKPGYACDIFYGGESYEVTARRIGQNRSSLFQINGSWWPYDNVLIANGVSSPITQNMDIYNSSEYSKIPWQKEPPYNLFGITYNSYYHVSGYDGHTVIANPVHYYGAGDGTNIPIQEQQSPIKITVSDEESQLTVYCWSLADSIDNNIITSTTVTRYTLGNDGMWYSDNDEMVVLEVGGETEVVNNQQATLDDLVSNIKTFFEGTWRHIRQLVTSAGKLPSVVVEMYSWLPEEYKAVLFSAFGIVIVVGILKVML